MALRFVCGDAFSCPHSHGLTRTDGSVCIYNIYTHPALYADLCTRVSSRRTCAAYAPRRVVCARARVCVGAPASAPTRASTLSRRRASRSRLAGVPVCVSLQREHRRMEHRTSHGLVLGMCRFRPARAPRRTALGRSSTHARPLCAVARPMCACAAVAMHIRAYVDGSPMDTHMCSIAIELLLHQGLSMSNAHTHRPCARCTYTQIRLYASIARACAYLSVCARVAVCVYGGALHACKLRKVCQHSGD
jgi:hypothetical protein